MKTGSAAGVSHIYSSEANSGERNSLPIYVQLLIIFACTDIYIVSGIKAVYLFVIPTFIYLVHELMYEPILRFNGSIFLVLWYASYFLSALHLVSPSDFVIVLVGQAALFTVCGLFSHMKSDGTINRAERLFQYVLCAMVVIGCIQLILYYSVGSTWGISHVNHGVGMPRMCGLSREPDWYGLLCTVCSLYLIFLKLEGKSLMGQVQDSVMLGIAVTMLVLSLVRAAWVGFGVGVFVLSFCRIDSAAKRRLSRGIVKLLAIGVVIIVFSSVAFPKQLAAILTRLDIRQWVTADGGASNTRIDAMEIAITYFRRHPFTGNGVGGLNAITGDSDLLASMGYIYEVNAGRGGANIVVTSLFDVGIIGTIFLMAFVVRLLRELFNAYKHTGDIKFFEYFIILVALLVDFQFNNGMRQTYVWAIIGIAIARIANSEARIGG